MSGALQAAPRRKPTAALIALVLMVAIPAAWVAWSSHAAAVTEAMNERQAMLLSGLRERMSRLATGPESTGALIDARSVYLPGETAAIAGAALQRLVAESVEAAGGRLVESEFTRSETELEQDPGAVDLRVSFDAEIVSLQRILFQLETGVPLLFLRGVTVQSAGAEQVAETESPPLRVIVQVGGYWETPQ